MEQGIAPQRGSTQKSSDFRPVALSHGRRNRTARHIETDCGVAAPIPRGAVPCGEPAR